MPIINHGVVLWRTLWWRHNGHDGVSNHQPHDCLLNRLFRLRSKKHQSSASLAFVRGIHRWLVNSPHKWQVTWKMFPFNDVIMEMNHLEGPKLPFTKWNFSVLSDGHIHLLKIITTKCCMKAMWRSFCIDLSRWYFFQSIISIPFDN